MRCKCKKELVLISAIFSVCTGQKLRPVSFNADVARHEHVDHFSDGPSPFEGLQTASVYPASFFNNETSVANETNFIEKQKIKEPQAQKAQARKVEGGAGIVEGEAVKAEIETRDLKPQKGKAQIPETSNRLIKNAQNKADDLILESAHQIKKTAEQIGVVAAKFERARATLRKVDKEFEKAEEEFLRDVDFKTVTEDDVPRADFEKLDSLQCPLNCNPAICDEGKEFTTQCLKVERTDEADQQNKKHICAKYEDEKLRRCPEDFVRCTAISPSRNQTYTFQSSTTTKSIFNRLILEGRNFNPCIRIFTLPLEMGCDVEHVESMQNATATIMGIGSQAVFPRVALDHNSAEFPRILILKEGHFNLCLVQMAANDNPHLKYGGVQFLAADIIGHVNATNPINHET